MDDSQSSDIFSDTGDFLCSNPTADIDTVSYNSFISSTKQAFSRCRTEIHKSTFTLFFSTLLEDCRTCICKSFDLITSLLDDTNLNGLIDYINDAVCILQMLSEFIQSVIETISMSCSNMRTFPTTTGKIIMSVFTHCKDSESLCGKNVSAVDTQLKELFRTCHELQLIYLVILEKHFLFDLTKREDKDILVEALDINLKIGEIVQMLNVKTMVQQWKAYTIICKKYCDVLKDENVYIDTTRALCKMITCNIKAAVQLNQEEKIVIRSLKVTSLTIKILSKIYNTFSDATKNTYDELLELLIFINLNSGPYLQLTADKSAEFMNIMHTNVSQPTDCLLTELLHDNNFVNYLLDYNVGQLKQEEESLAYILIIVSTINFVLDQSKQKLPFRMKHKLIECIYRFLPSCNIWFHIGLTLNNSFYNNTNSEYNGLYQHLLIQTLALITTMDAMEFKIMEKKMIEAIFKTDCCSSMFSSSLWVLLTRYNRRFVFNQLICLIKMYRKLENNILFQSSPQKVHFTYTIQRLFKAMSEDDKTNIYEQFSIRDTKNISLWIVLEIRNLPENVRYIAEEYALDNFKKHFEALFQNKLNCSGQTIKLMNMMATCSLESATEIWHEELEKIIIKIFMTMCPISNEIMAQNLYSCSKWHMDYLEALLLLTESMFQIICDSSANIIKILHIIVAIIQIGSIESKLLSINILYKLSTYEVYDANRSSIDSSLKQIYRKLLNDSENVIRNKLLILLRNCKRNNNANRIISSVLNEDEQLKATWCDLDSHIVSTSNWREQLLTTMGNKYRHKCCDTKNTVASTNSRFAMEKRTSCSSNFDFDIENLLEDHDKPDEPICKKAKLNEAHIIINRLESDAELLSKVKENLSTFEYTSRIQHVCDKLRSIIG